MATKPLSSTLPRWADTVAGDPAKVSEPASGKKDIGWLVAEKPPAQWKNWLLLQTYNWLVWLDALETEPHTWTKLQTFQIGIRVTQSTANTRAIHATGNGMGEGALFEGGTGGHGAVGQCFGPANYGLYGKGDPAGAASFGVRGEGGLDGAGGSFVGSGNGYGLRSQGGGTSGVGVYGVGTGALPGVFGTSSGAGVGVSGVGGPTGGGVYGQGGATSGRGGEFLGTGAASGVEATGGPTGHGAICNGGGTSGDGIRATGGPVGYGGLFTGGTGDAAGVRSVASGNGVGLEAIAGGTGFSIYADGRITTATDVYANNNVIVGTGAVCTVNGSKIEFVTVTHPAGTASIKHQVRPINTVRAYLSLVTDGAGGHTIEDSVGIASVALTATTIDVTFADAFATAKYVASPTGNGATYRVDPANKAAGTCKVTSSLNPTGNILALDVTFFGRQ